MAGIDYSSSVKSPNAASSPGCAAPSLRNRLFSVGDITLLLLLELLDLRVLPRIAAAMGVASMGLSSLNASGEKHFELVGSVFGRLTISPRGSDGGDVTGVWIDLWTGDRVRKFESLREVVCVDSTGERLRKFDSCRGCALLVWLLTGGACVSILCSGWKMMKQWSM